MSNIDIKTDDVPITLDWVEGEDNCHTESRYFAKGKDEYAYQIIKNGANSFFVSKILSDGRFWPIVLENEDEGKRGFSSFDEAKARASKDFEQAE